MTITVYDNFDQGSLEWFAARCGLLTASEVKKIITPAKLQFANNDVSKAHVFEIAAQRINNYVEPSYQSDDMLRGCMEEIEAKQLYQKEYAPLKDAAFIINDALGFPVGYSPDGLVGDDGLIEVKSRCQKHQLATIYNGELPNEYLLQIQTGLFVTNRDWCDFLSYCGGMPMFVLRVHRDNEIMGKILEAATAFEGAVQDKIETYRKRIVGLHPTQRINYGEVI